MFTTIKKYLSEGNVRSVKAKKNILSMLLIKGGSIIASLLLVPLTLHYVDSDTYGIWLTLSSMVAWISFLDIGLNNGLKNRLTEALAKGDFDLAKKYVTTTYVLMTMIFIPLMVILLLVIPHIDWNSLLKVNIDPNTFVIAVSIIVTYFCFNFILNTINVVMTADQRPADAALQNFLQQLLSVIIIFAMTKLTEGSLVRLCIGLCLSPLVVVTLFNFALYRKRYRDISPSLRAVDFSTVPDMMKLGVQFFIIQIAGVIQYQMVNFLIIRNFGADDVTSYNIAYKYFSVLYMVWTILITPVWVAVTDAISKNDYVWVRDTAKKYCRILLLFIAGSVIMLVASPLAYRLWVGDAVDVEFGLSFWVMSYFTVTMFASIFVSILNGAGILKVQTIACIISPFVFLGVTYILIRCGFGVPSIIIGSIVANFNGLILAPVQCRRLLRI